MLSVLLRFFPFFFGRVVHKFCAQSAMISNRLFLELGITRLTPEYPRLVYIEASVPSLPDAIYTIKGHTASESQLLLINTANCTRAEVTR